MFRGRPAHAMTKLCIFAGTMILGYGFGFASDAAGFSFWWSFFWSGVGSILGVIVGWKVAQKFK
jgi:hypothetical protein